MDVHFDMSAWHLTCGLLTNTMAVVTFEIMKHYGDDPVFKY